jgi:ABC-type maltose transport system permease subunit
LPLKLSHFRATALGNTVITCAPILINEALLGGEGSPLRERTLLGDIQANSSGHAMTTTADYVVFAVLVAVPVVIVWFALSRHEF